MRSAKIVAGEKAERAERRRLARATNPQAALDLEQVDPTSVTGLVGDPEASVLEDPEIGELSPSRRATVGATWCHAESNSPHWSDTSAQGRGSVIVKTRYYCGSTVVTQATFSLAGDLVSAGGGSIDGPAYGPYVTVHEANYGFLVPTDGVWRTAYLPKKEFTGRFLAGKTYGSTLFGRITAPLLSPIDTGHGPTCYVTIARPFC